MWRLCSIVATSSIAVWSTGGLAAERPNDVAEKGELPPLSELQPPRPLQELTASYPYSASGEHFVTVELLIGAAGDLVEVSVVEGDEPFASSALASAKNWHFVPAVSHGRRVSARIWVVVHFTPPSDEAPPPTLEATTAPISKDTEPPPVEVTVLGDIPAAGSTLGRADVRQMPGAFGDPFRAVEAQPGVTPIATGLPYFFVRGAPPGNVGYFFDDMSIPLLYHGAAGPGVIHPAFIENVNLYPAAYPAKYGRYAGGILEGELAEPEARLRGQASVRLLDAGAFVEVPFGDGRGTVMLGGRYSYAGLLVSALSPDVDVAYWDYQALGSYALSPSEDLSVFAFGSHDYLTDTSQPEEPVEMLNLTFHRARVKYQKRLTSRTSIGASAFGGLSRTAATEDRNDDPGATDVSGQLLGLSLNADHQFDDSLSVHVGADTFMARNKLSNDQKAAPQQTPWRPSDGKYRRSNDPNSTWRGHLTLSSAETDAIERLPDATFPPDAQGTIDFENGVESLVRGQFISRTDVNSAAWVELGWRPTPNVLVKPALRFDSFVSGKTWAYGIDPRVTARYRLSDTLAMVHTLGTAHQPASFALPIAGLNPPPSTRLQHAIQSSAGAEFTLPEALFASVTAYQNVTRNSSDVLGVSRFGVTSSEVDPFVERTTAHSYGIEFLVRRSFSKTLGGLLAYTLSRSTRSVALASGISSFDRTHVINLAASHALGNNWRLGGRFVTYSGIPASVAALSALASPPRTPWFYRVDWRLEKRWALGSDGGWLALVAEVVNTTLNEEVLNSSCYAYGCAEQTFGPVTLPSLGVEASL